MQNRRPVPAVLTVRPRAALTLVAADIDACTRRSDELYAEVRELERQHRALQAKLRDLKRVERQGGHLLPLELAGR